MILEPRSAIRLVTRANASRPLSVNSIVTTGAFVVRVGRRLRVLDVGAVQLRVVLEHEEALDLRRLVGHRARPRPPRCPRGTSITREPAGGPPEPSAFELLQARRALGVLGRGARRRVVVGEQLLAELPGLVVAGAERLLVGPDRELVGAEEVVARRCGRVVAAASASAGVMSEPGGTSVASALGFSLEAASAAWKSALRARVGRVRGRGRGRSAPSRRTGAGRWCPPARCARSAFCTSGRPTEIWSRPGALDLGLGDAERVGALADRVDRVVDRLRRDLRHLRRGPPW